MGTTMKLITILQSLREHPRRLTDDENLYIEHLSDELKRAPSDAARWRIVEREGLTRLESFDFDADVLGKLTEIRLAAMH
jgi:hypothetical protein